jgi:hypothetical protein
MSASIAASPIISGAKADGEGWRVAGWPRDRRHRDGAVDPFAYPAAAMDLHGLAATSAGMAFVPSEPPPLAEKRGVDAVAAVAIARRAAAAAAAADAEAREADKAARAARAAHEVAKAAAASRARSSAGSPAALAGGKRRRAEGGELPRAARCTPTSYKQRVAAESAGGPKAAAIKSKKCVDCGLVQPVFALPEDTRTKWCAGCSKSHPGAVRRVALPRMCEDCGEKRPEFGLAIEGKRRWCSICAVQHEGAMDVGNKKCEDCKQRAPSFGLMADKKRRWCSSCAKKFHQGEGAVSRTEWGKAKKAKAPAPAAPAAATAAAERATCL